MTSSANGLAVDPVQSHAELRDAGNDSKAHLPLGSAPTFFMSEQPLVQVETVFRPLAASPDSGEAREPVIPAISDRPKTEEDSPTVLPEGWKFTGEIEVDGPIDIGGRLDGMVMQHAKGAVVKVTNTGVMKGQILADTIQVQGSFDGHLDASGGSVTVDESARLLGKVSYSTIRMSGGQHKIEMVYVAAAPLAKSQGVGE